MTDYGDLDVTMTTSLGNADSVRALGQALLRAAGALSSVTDELSGRVNGLVPGGWSGSPADRFWSDWNGKAGQARQLAAACDHVGRVLTELADQLDGANQQAAAAQQMTGGVGSRFANAGTGQRSQQVLSQANAAAQQAQAAARAKLAGIQVPRFGPGLTASQVDAWAKRTTASQPSLAGLDHLLHEAGNAVTGLVDPRERQDRVGNPGWASRLIDRWLADAKGYAQRNGIAAWWGGVEKTHLFGVPTVGQDAHFAEGLLDGAMAMLRTGMDLTQGPDGGMGRWLFGDPSEAQSLQGLYRLGEAGADVSDPWLPGAQERSTTDLSVLKGFGKGFLAWDEWRKDPARAAGNALFNLASVLFGAKGLRAPEASGDAPGIAKSAEAPRDPGQPGDPASPAPLRGSAATGRIVHSRLEVRGRLVDVYTDGHRFWTGSPEGPAGEGATSAKLDRSPADLSEGEGSKQSRFDRLGKVSFELGDDIHSVVKKDVDSLEKLIGQKIVPPQHPLEQALLHLQGGDVLISFMALTVIVEKVLGWLRDNLLVTKGR